METDMRIHTVKGGEGAREIAREYEISEELLRAYNGLSGGEFAVGEELCVPCITRCFKMRRGDSLESLANRFSSSKKELLRINPQLSAKAEIGNVAALKIAERPYGGAVCLGYIYGGCGEEELSRALPYLTYAVICAGIRSERGVGLGFSTEGIKRKLCECGVPYLLRFHDRSDGRAKMKPDDIVSLLESEGAVGAVIPCEGGLGESVAGLLPELSAMIKEKGMLLISEVDEKSPEEIYKSTEASIFSCDALESDKTATSILDFSAKRGTGLGFIELPCLAKVGEEFTSVCEVLELARRREIEIKSSPDGMVFSFLYRGREVRLPSLKNVKSHLDLVKEAGLSGVCFDVMRTPISTLMTYTSLFNTRGALPRENGGCIRE